MHVVCRHRRAVFASCWFLCGFCGAPSMQFSYIILLHNCVRMCIIVFYGIYPLFGQRDVAMCSCGEVAVACSISISNWRFN